MSSPSALIKVNYLVIRYLYFESVLGDLQEAQVYGKRLRDYASRCQFLFFRAHNRGFCAFFAFGTLVFGHFEHKIEFFVLFWASKPSFSGVSSTKSGFLCAFSREGGVCRHGNLIADPPVWVRRGILVGSSCGWLLRLCGLRPWRGLRWLLL